MKMKTKQWAVGAAALGLMISGTAAADCPAAPDMDALAEAVVAGTPATAPAGPETLADGYCGQEMLVERLTDVFGPPLGYKVGLTTQATQERFGVSTPIYGVLMADMLLDDGASVPAAFGAVPIWEPDIIVRIADAVAANSARTPEEALSAIDAVYPFIELADLVLAQGQPLNGPNIAMINVGARLGVVGAPIPIDDDTDWVTILAGMDVVVTDGEGAETIRIPGAAILGNPLNALTFLAEALAERGGSLSAGDLVSLGGFGPPTPAQSGASITVTYEGLPGDPAVSVSFE